MDRLLGWLAVVLAVLLASTACGQDPADHLNQTETTAFEGTVLRIECTRGHEIIWALREETLGYEVGQVFTTPVPELVPIVFRRTRGDVDRDADLDDVTSGSTVTVWHHEGAIIFDTNPRTMTAARVEIVLRESGPQSGEGAARNQAARRCLE